MSMFPYIFQNISDSTLIQKTIDYINSRLEDFGSLSEKNYWQGRSIYSDKIKDASVKEIIDQSVRVAAIHLKPLINKPIYFEQPLIARWPTGYELRPHADSENPTGFPPHAYPWRDFAVITFLNNDFTGGKLYFPNQKLEIDPVPGLTAIFPGTLEYLHGVSKITEGARYTIACFVTYDSSKGYMII